jgi:2-polyprenyl-3-methyl-5-hydroxy-6-metoxy-1,4-benzoquinol methylase
MKFPGLDMLTAVAGRCRDVMRRAAPGLLRGIRWPAPGRFQPYSHTAPDRYPLLFEFAAARLGHGQGLRILSFGCSRGDEVFTLRNYFPAAAIKGIDIDPRNIACCLARARAARSTGMTFATAATTESEEAESYDAIFCLAVLCHGDLTTSGAQHSDPLVHFDNFARVVADFARCLKPGGLLLLQTTNFRFCDTSTAQDFDVVLEADRARLAPDVIFDRDGRLLNGVQYRAVAFRKRDPVVRQATADAAAN